MEIQQKKISDKIWAVTKTTGPKKAVDILSLNL